MMLITTHLSSFSSFIFSSTLCSQSLLLHLAFFLTPLLYESYRDVATGQPLEPWLPLLDYLPIISHTIWSPGVNGSAHT